MASLRTLKRQWKTDQEKKGIVRTYSPEDVLRLRGSLQIAYTFADAGSRKLLRLLEQEPYVAALGALTGNQAVQQVRAGLRAIYCSGWQVAADANTAGQTYPDQSLYPVNSVPLLVKRINQALQRADQIDRLKGDGVIDWYAPIIADAEAGFGGALNGYELTKSMIEAGAAGIHLEDQLSSEKKCGHMGGKVLVPASQFIRMLAGARLAADVCDTQIVLIARTDAYSAALLQSDADPTDRPFLSGERTSEGFYRLNGKQGGLEFAIARGLVYAPYADMLWWETSTPDLDQAQRFAQAIHSQYPGKLLAYNCSPSFNWKKNLNDDAIAGFQKELAGMGYKFQFVTLAGFHALNLSMFELARDYRQNGMTAYVKLQQAEFAATENGYTAVEHQKEVGTGYFDAISEIVSGGGASTLAMKGSTEEDQFRK